MNSIRHVGIIMDGNGRWAEKRGLPRWKGHEAGIEAVRRVTKAACRHGISVLTLFAFSSENWKRPAKEVNILFSLFRRYLRETRDELIKNGIRLSAIGRRDRLSEGVREGIAAAESATLAGERLHLRLAIDYGSRQEIARAAQSLAELVARGLLQPQQIDEGLFIRTMASEAVPDPDLIIRTAGERRLSNFLLWQSAYAEFHFSSSLWPDFEEADFEEALADYQLRTRKFGALSCSATAIAAG
jgi:undecaprenyl diphosphate synthase